MDDVRFSFADQSISTEEVYKCIYELSYINTGDQQTKLANTHDKMVY